MEEPNKVDPVRADEPGSHGTKGPMCKNCAKASVPRSTGAREPGSQRAKVHRSQGATGSRSL